MFFDAGGGHRVVATAPIAVLDGQHRGSDVDTVGPPGNARAPGPLHVDLIPGKDAPERTFPF
jgi:hypothetical protein